MTDRSLAAATLAAIHKTLPLTAPLVGKLRIGHAGSIPGAVRVDLTGAAIVWTFSESLAELRHTIRGAKIDGVFTVDPGARIFIVDNDEWPLRLSLVISTR